MINNLDVRIPNTIKNIDFGSQGLTYNFRFFDTLPFRTLNLVDEGFSEVRFTATNSDVPTETIFKQTVSLTGSASSTITIDIPLVLEREDIKRCIADLSIELVSLSGTTMLQKYKKVHRRLINIK